MSWKKQVLSQIWKPVFIYIIILISFVTNSIAYEPSEFKEVYVTRVDRLQTYGAVGTIRPCSEIRIESQVNAQVKIVQVQSGTRVSQGQLLMILDERQALSRINGAKASMNQAISSRKQALQALVAAKAAHNEASLQYKRVKDYYKSGAATKMELEKVESANDQAKAGLNRAKQAMKTADSGIRQAKELLSQTKVGAEFYRIKAPVDGEVIQRMVEPGDLALPGKTLITLRAESGFRMESHVREGLIHTISPGMTLMAEITSLGKTCKALVEEVIPYADPETRTFLVKAVLPEIRGIFPGMYGKLFIPEGNRQAIMAPKEAIIYSGQLELVRVQTDNGWSLRYIKTGDEFNGQVEILSGLSGDEILGVAIKKVQGDY